MSHFELFAEITLGKIIHGNVDESSACVGLVGDGRRRASLFDHLNACQKVSIIWMVGFIIPPNRTTSSSSHRHPHTSPKIMHV